jgi:hypothetical protein
MVLFKTIPTEGKVLNNWFGARQEENKNNMF